MPTPQLTVHEATILAVALDSKDRLVNRYVIRDAAKKLLKNDERATESVLLNTLQNLLDTKHLVPLSDVPEDILVTERGREALEQFLLTTAAIHDEVSKTHVITA